MGGLQVTELDVTQCGVDFHQVFGVGAECFCFQMQSAVVIHIFLSKGREFDTVILNRTVANLFFKQGCLSVQLFLDLRRGHAGFRCPGHFLPNLLAVDVVAVGDDDPVAVPAFFNGSHGVQLLSVLAPCPNLCYYKWAQWCLGCGKLWYLCVWAVVLVAPKPVYNRLSVSSIGAVLFCGAGLLNIIAC